jgi:hypothetical protein
MKSIFKSKTFWLNVLGIAGTVVGAIPAGVPTIITGGAINIVLRILTKEPVSILPQPVPPVD